MALYVFGLLRMAVTISPALASNESHMLPGRSDRLCGISRWASKGMVLLSSCSPPAVIVYVSFSGRIIQPLRLGSRDGLPLKPGLKLVLISFSHLVRISWHPPLGRREFSISEYF